MYCFQFGGAYLKSFLLIFGLGSTKLSMLHNLKRCFDIKNQLVKLFIMKRLNYTVLLQNHVSNPCAISRTKACDTPDKKSLLIPVLASKLLALRHFT